MVQGTGRCRERLIDGGHAVVGEGSPLRILLVDEAPDAERYVARWLGADLPAVEVRKTPGAAALHEALASATYDVVITEAHLSWASGLDVLRAVRKRSPEHPVLMLTGQGDEDLAVAALQAGFDAYLRKGPDQGGRLAAAISASLRAARERAARRQAERALLESEARHRVIVETASDAIVTMDERGIIESVNPAVQRIFQYEPHELVGQSVTILMPGAVLEEHDGCVECYLCFGDPHMIGTGRVIEARRRDGAGVQVDLAISEIWLGGRRLFTGMMRDITERLRAEDERLLLLNRERSAISQTQREAAEKTLILENMRDAVIVTDREGRYTLVNPAAGRLLGMDPSDLIGLGIDERPWLILDEFGAPISYEQRPIVRALRGERTSMVQRVKTVDGRDVMVRAATAPVRNDVGEIVGSVHVVQDVTEEFARAQQTAQGARLRSLGQLAGGVAHDLNQYLGLVVGYGDLATAALNQSTVDLESVQDSLSTMVRAAVDGAEAVRRLLLFARPSAEGPAERVELDAVMRDVVKLTAPRWRDAAQQQGRPILVDLEIEGEVAVDGWASDLREVFTNLVLNAIDALPKGGTIRLAARPADTGVIAEVVDSGIGMSAETRGKLFEPFFSTKGEGGSGLGLAIVFGIVERHGGTIAVDSEPAHGTTFRLTFPPAAQPEAARPVLSDPDEVDSLRILVVDDEPALVTMLARILSSDGHTVAVATSGEQALTLLVNTPVDVIISDLGMGAGMNGWDLAAAVRTMPNSPYFILTTGWGAEIDPDEAVTRAVHAVVAKPYRLPDLRKVLATRVGRK